MEIALLAALCMVFEDIIATVMVQAEAGNHGIISGLCDCIGWGLAIATTAITVTALQGHNLHEKILVITLVTIANFLGSILGVEVGKRVFKMNVSWKSLFLKHHLRHKKSTIRRDNSGKLIF